MTQIYSNATNFKPISPNKPNKMLRVCKKLLEAQQNLISSESFRDLALKAPTLLALKFLRFIKMKCCCPSLNTRSFVVAVAVLDGCDKSNWSLTQ